MASEKLGNLELIRNHLEADGSDAVRTMVKAMAQKLMSAEVDALCGADYGSRSDERVNERNGYRSRDWDTRAGTVELEIPKLRQGTYFPDWLLEPRRRAERALLAVVTESYVLGVSTRRVDRLVKAMGLGARLDRWDQVKAIGSAPTADFFDVTPPQVEAKPAALDDQKALERALSCVAAVRRPIRPPTRAPKRINCNCCWQAVAGNDAPPLRYAPDDKVKEPPSRIVGRAPLGACHHEVDHLALQRLR